MFLLPLTFILCYILANVLERFFWLEKAQREKLFYSFIPWIYQYLTGVSVLTYLPPLENMGKKILVLSNHPGFVDFLTLMCFHAKHFPDHDNIFVISKTYQKIPYFGKYFYNSPHIPMYKGISKEELEIHKKYLEEYDRPCVVYIFPEGNISCPKNIKKKKSPFPFSLIPKSTGITHLLPVMDQVIDITILYKGSPAYNETPMLLGEYPSSALMIGRDVTNTFDKKTIDESLGLIWTNKNKLIQVFENEKKDILISKDLLLGGNEALFLFFSSLFLWKSLFAKLAFGIFLIDKFYWKRFEKIETSKIVFFILVMMFFF